MKSLKKILAVLVTTALVASMGIMAFGANTGSIVIHSNESVNINGKGFTAYRILDATYSSGDDTIAYSIPDTLKGFYLDYFPTASGAAAASGTTLDQKVVEYIMAIGNDAAEMQRFVKAAKKWLVAGSGTASYEGHASGTGDGTATFSGLDTGYYLIVDNSTQEPISSLMLDTVFDDQVDIVIKANDTTPEKKIVGVSGSNNQVIRPSGTEIITLDDANNGGVGMTVNFQLKQYVPNYTGYNQFYFIINDKLDAGLTLLPETIKVFVDGNGDGAYSGTFTTQRHEGVNSGTTSIEEQITSIPNKREVLVEGEDYYQYVKASDGVSGTTPEPQGGATFSIAFDDIREYPIDAPILVTYSARINSNAITGKIPNKNAAYVIFSNDPSLSSGTKPGSGTNQPGYPDDTSKNPVGSGTTDYTYTFTTELDLTKVDNNNQPLEGVQFNLIGTSSQVVVNGEERYVESPSGTYYLLNNGRYTTEAPETKSSMIPADPGATSGYVIVGTNTENDAKSDQKTWVNFSGTKYRPYMPSESGTIYVLNKANDQYYKSTVVKYERVTEVSVEGKENVNVSMFEETDASGSIVFKQLGAGDYRLIESKVPAGYNKAGDITFTITYATSGTDANNVPIVIWDKSGVTQGGASHPEAITYNSGTGKFEVRVVNAKGVELPSTGGIGTTIFYAGGAILVLLAGILLVSKRRFA